MNVNQVFRVALYSLLLCLLFGSGSAAFAQTDADLDSLVKIGQALENFSQWWAESNPPLRSGLPTLAFNRGDDGAFILGSPNAPVTLIEFADFACLHCQSYRPAISQFIETYVRSGRARLEFRFFPTVGGETTVLAGHAAECADTLQRGAFWQAHELLYEYALTNRYNDRVPSHLARDLALPEAELLACMETATQVEVDVAFGRSVGVSGTPAVMVRYAGGLPQFIHIDGRTYRSGGPDFGILGLAIERAQFR